MKDKKSNQDKVIEAIEQDTMDEVYEALENGYQDNRKIAVLFKTFPDKEREYVDFASIISIPNGYRLESISGGYGVSTITKDKRGHMKTDGVFVQKVINDRVGRAIFAKQNAEKYYINAITEHKYFGTKLELTKDELIKKMNNKIEAYDSAKKNGTIHYMKNNIEDNIHDIRDLRENVFKICVWYGIFILLLFMGFIAIFTKLPK